VARVYQDPRSPLRSGRRPWFIDYVDMNGCRHRERTPATTKAEAEAILRARLGEIAKATIVGARSVEAVKPMTFEQFVRQEYLPHSKATNRPSSHRRDVVSSRNILPKLGNILLRAMSRGDIQRYLDQRLGEKTHKGKPPAPATVNREFAFISGVLSEALARGYVEHHAASGIRMLPEENERVRWLTYEEEEKLLERASAWLRPIVVAAVETGLRRSELLRLAWADVDRLRRQIRVEYGKNHSVRYVPTSARFEKLLESLPPFIGAEGKVPCVFVNPKTGLPFEEGGVSHAFLRAARAAKLTDVRFHDLRHTFASRLVQEGVPLNNVRELLGHRSMAMVLRYAHLAPSNLRDAIDALDRGRQTPRQVETSLGKGRPRKPTHA
jgi:integrase